MEVPQQRSPYSRHVVVLCVYKYCLLGMSCTEIAEQCNHHPSHSTIRLWVKNCQLCGEIIAATGRKGVRQVETRKSDDYAKMCLELLVAEDEAGSLLDFAIQLRDMTGLEWSQTDVCRALKVGRSRRQCVQPHLQFQLCVKPMHGNGMRLTSNVAVWHNPSSCCMTSLWV